MPSFLTNSQVRIVSQFIPKYFLKSFNCSLFGYCSNTLLSLINISFCVILSIIFDSKSSFEYISISDKLKFFNSSFALYYLLI